jgi:DNA-binding response OmpR family regulator
MRVAILEDDLALTAQLQAILTDASHSCFTFQTGRRLINFLLHETVDILLLDWNVPDITGMDVVRWAHENLDRPPPILMMTSRVAEEDVISALQAGADDYVIKPIQPKILVARIEAIYRRVYPARPEGTVEGFGVYVFDTRTETLLMLGEPVPMTAKEFALALMFFRNLHRTLSRSYLFETLWGSRLDLQTRTLDAHISRIRGKLSLRASNGFRLVPVYAYGYRLETTD